MELKYAIQFIRKQKINGTASYMKSATDSKIWYLQLTNLYMPAE